MKYPPLYLFNIFLLIIFLSCGHNAGAATQLHLEKKTLHHPAAIHRVSPIRMAPPDLVLQKAAWSRPPVEGDLVGKSSVITIVIQNRGQGPAGPNKLKIQCRSLTGNNCPTSFNTTLVVPPLAANKSTALSWPSLSTEKWSAGRFSLSFQVDPENRVKESNEQNNKRRLPVTIRGRLKTSKKDNKRHLAKISRNRADMFLPDLYIQNLHWSTIPFKGDTIGSSSILNISVINKGHGPAKQNRMKLAFTTRPASTCPAVLNGSLAIPNLSPGRVVNLRWPPVSSQKWPGTKFTLCASADSGEKIRESNEKNNKKCLIFDVRERKNRKPDIAFLPGIPVVNKPDLTVTSVTPNQQDVKSGDSISFKVVIKNQGNAPSSRTDAIVSFKSHLEGRFNAVKMTVPAIAPGQSVTVISPTDTMRTAYGLPIGGTIDLRATVDNDDRVKEIDENNNKMTSRMTARRVPDFYVYDFSVLNISRPNTQLVRKKISIYAKERLRCFVIIDADKTSIRDRFSPGKIVVKATDLPDFVLPSASISEIAQGFNVNFFVGPWTKKGPKRITIYIDADNEIEEIKEFNNTGLFLVDVY